MNTQKKIKTVISKIISFFIKHPMLVLNLLILITTVFVYWPCLFQDKIFMYNDAGSDTRYVYYPFFISLFRKLSQHDMSLWLWEYGTGTNILSRQADAGSVFTWLTLAGGVNNVKYMLVLIQILKIFICGQLCYIYLKNFNISNYSNIIVSYIYAFNGFLILWGQHYFMGSASVYIILVLVSIEKALKNKKGYVFLSASVAIVLISSYYFGYMILLFAAIYSLFRILHIYPYKQIKKAFAKIGGLIGSVLIGGMMSAVVFLPSVYMISTASSRLSENMGLIAKVSHYFTNLYSSTDYWIMLNRIFSNNLMGTTNYIAHGNYYEAPQFYFTSLFLVFIYLYIFELIELTFEEKINKKEKVLKWLEVSLILFLVINPLGSVIFNGFVQPFYRYTYILMPVMGLCYAHILDKIMHFKLKHRYIKIMMAVLFSVFILLSVAEPVELQNLNESWSGFNLPAVIIGVYIIFFVIVNFILKKDKKLYFKLGATLLMFMIVWDVNIESYITTNARWLCEESNSTVLHEESSVKKAVKYIEKIDSSLCRIDKTFMETAFLNEGLLYGYKGVSVYNSVLNKNLLEFAEKVCPNLPVEGKGGVCQDFAYICKDVEYVSLLGVKYILSRDEINDVSDYELLQKIDDINIYKNKNVESIGRFYNSTIKYSDYMDLDATEKIKAINNKIIVGDEEKINNVNSNDEYSNLHIENPENSSIINFDVNVDQNGWIFMSIPFENGWKAYVDGEEIEIVQADVGYSAIPIEAGAHQILFKYQTPLLLEGGIISIIGILLFLIMCIVFKLK